MKQAKLSVMALYPIGFLLIPVLANSQEHLTTAIPAHFASKLLHLMDQRVSVISSDSQLNQQTPHQQSLLKSLTKLQ